MPGTKRKIDEDTWIVTQSKKFKCGQLLSNVYASTLAQLRLGSRSIFSQEKKESKTPFNSPPSSPMVRDILSHDDLNLINGPRPQQVCGNCTNKNEGWDKCYYCEKTMCHVNQCTGCGEGFCSQCCVAKYNVPSGEGYVCYGCLH